MNNPPTQDEVREEFRRRELSEAYADKFFRYYASRHWQIRAGIPLDLERAYNYWAEHAGEDERLTFVRPKDLTPTEPLARGQPTFTSPTKRMFDPYAGLSDEERAERRRAVKELRAVGVWILYGYIRDQDRIAKGQKPQHLYHPEILDVIQRNMPLRDKYHIRDIEIKS